MVEIKDSSDDFNSGIQPNYRIERSSTLNEEITSSVAFEG